MVSRLEGDEAVTGGEETGPKAELDGINSAIDREGIDSLEVWAVDGAAVIYIGIGMVKRCTRNFDTSTDGTNKPASILEFVT